MPFMKLGPQASPFPALLSAAKSRSRKQIRLPSRYAYTVLRSDTMHSNAADIF